MGIDTSSPASSPDDFTPLVERISIYGAGAQTWGAATVLIAVAVVILVLLLTVQLFSVPLSIDFTKELNIEPGPITPFSLNFIHVPRPADGPVLITIDVQLDSFVNELRLIYLRNGAYSWHNLSFLKFLQSAFNRNQMASLAIGFTLVLFN